MIGRRPDRVVLVVVLLGTLMTVAAYVGGLLLARDRQLEVGERQVKHFGIMMAEHTARSFEAVDILLRDISTELSEHERSWESWEPSRGWDYLVKRHSRSLPQLRDLIVFDRGGDQRYISTYFPTPHINVRDRPYFLALEGGQSSASFGPYIGRNSGRYTYALARRISDVRRNFAGVVFAAIETSYYSEFCWANRLADDFESVIINAKGLVVATCRPTDLSKQSPTLGAPAVDALYGGKLRGWLPATGVARNNGLIASVSPVPDFSDLRVLTVQTEASVLEAWRARSEQVGALILLVAAILLSGGALVRWQVRKLQAMTAELEASQVQLTARVSEATRELAAQKDEAERANHAKSRFLAAASHDLRQPMHALALFANDLQRQVRTGTSGELGRLAEQIATSTSLLGQMLDSLLDISRLDVGGIKPEIKAFALAPMFERLAASFRRTAVNRNQTLIFRPTADWIESDPLMLERMLANLISNALRYTPAGGRVLIAARRRGGAVRIEVRDNGQGIAPEHQAAIFSEFYPVGNAARESTQGLGLGLSIIDRLARALDIEVSLRSAAGRGTVFGLRLKTGQPRTVINSAPPAANDVAIHFVGQGDELQAAMGLARSWNYAVSQTTAADGPPPAILKRMVVITLGSLAATVRSACPPATPVIALVDLPDASLPAGVHALSSPLRPAKLRALLEQLQKTLLKSMP